jgi:hypothetical protein
MLEKNSELCGIHDNRSSLMVKGYFRKYKMALSTTAVSLKKQDLLSVAGDQGVSS